MNSSTPNAYRNDPRKNGSSTGRVRLATENSAPQEATAMPSQTRPLSKWAWLMLVGKNGDGPHFQAAFFSSRSARRRILPTLVLGSSARNSTYFGRL